MLEICLLLRFTLKKTFGGKRHCKFSLGHDGLHTAAAPKLLSYSVFGECPNNYLHDPLITLSLGPKPQTLYWGTP